MADFQYELTLSRLRSLRKELTIETSNGRSIYSVKPKILAATKTYVVFDTEGNDVAEVAQCISLIVPKYRISIKNTTTFYVSRKFSLSHDYSIKGLPWIVNGDFTSFRYRVLDQDSKNLFEIRKELGRGDNRYVLRVFKPDYVLHGICLAIAIDAAISAIHSSSN